LNKKPSAVYNVDSNYIIVCYGYNEGYLVRKSDGAVFSLEDVGVPARSAQGGNAYGARIIQQDAQGNIYYGIEPYPYSLIKLDISNPERIIKTTVISATQGTGGAFDVSSTSNIIYGNFVVRKTNGGLFYVPDSDSLAPWWIGLDGSIRYGHPGGDGVSDPVTGDWTSVIAISTIDPNSYGVSTKQYGVIGGEFWFWGRGPNLELFRFPNKIIFIDDRHIDINDEYFVATGIIEIENQQDTVVHIPLSTKLKNYRIIASSDNCLYLFGNDTSNRPTLIKLNISSYAVTVLLQPNAYDIYKISVSSDNNVSFNALRMSDGAIVIGEISASGQVKILDTALNTEVVALERIK
jgi:hypothetical protein